MTARSDVYSAGVVLYEMVTGEWPFDAESQVEMLRMHLMQAPPAMESKREGLHVSPALAAIVQRSLAKKAEQRFANAGEMLAALEAIPVPAAWIDATRPSMVAMPLPPPSTVPQVPIAQAPVTAPQSGSSSTMLIAVAIGVGGLFCLVLLAALAFYFLR